MHYLEILENAGFGIIVGARVLGINNGVLTRFTKAFTAMLLLKLAFRLGEMAKHGKLNN